MGYRVILEARGVLKKKYARFPEYLVSLDRDDPFHAGEDDDLDAFARLARKITDMHLDAPQIFSLCEYDRQPLPPGKFRIDFRKRAYDHPTFLEPAYVEFMTDVVAPITERITACTIEHDDHDCRVTTYTDYELRGNDSGIHVHELSDSDLVRAVESCRVLKHHKLVKELASRFKQRDAAPATR